MLLKRSVPAHLLLALSLALLLSACKGDLQRSLSGSRPNIIFILADDMGWADLPVYGNQFNEAPNLTHMAEEGIRFTDAYAACPVCSPTRASIMSGQYPARVGITDYITGHWRPFEEVIVPKNRQQYLPLEIYTMAEAMKDAGYRTGYYGKWHLGGEKYYPDSHGFDWWNIYQGGGFFNYAKRMSTPIEVAPGTVLSEALTDLSLRFIEDAANQPFFLYLSHFDVHVQLDADSTLIDKYLNKQKVPGYPCNAVYAAMVEHVDQSTGRILEKLDEMGLSENTLVLFFSDNGGLVSRFDRIPLITESKQYLYKKDPLLYVASSNAPLRAEKGTLYEGGIREPMIMWWPGKLEQGVVNEEIISSVDFLPTFAELAGIELPGNQVIDGKSLVGIMEGKGVDPERAIYWHYPVYHHDSPASAIRKGDWKLIHYLVDDRIYLYNLKQDIGESRNLSELEPEKVAELYQQLEKWREDCHAEFPEPNPDFDPEKRFTWGVHPDRL
ncbi:MAG: sulfatase [Bacteroidales bacterium]|nr:sulfatase [Bacteroidales bacterium]